MLSVFCLYLNQLQRLSKFRWSCLTLILYPLKVQLLSGWLARPFRYYLTNISDRSYRNSAGAYQPNVFLFDIISTYCMSYFLSLKGNWDIINNETYK